MILVNSENGRTTFFSNVSSDPSFTTVPLKEFSEFFENLKLDHL